MGKILKRTALLSVCGIVLMLAAFPFALPPVAEKLISSFLAEQGVPAEAKVWLGYCWTSTGPGLRGTLALSALNTPWLVRSEFGASLSHWHADVRLDETAFNERDPLLAHLLQTAPLASVSNLTFSGAVSFKATAERTWSMPVPVWSAKISLKEVSARAQIDGMPLECTNLSVPLGVSGIASHVDLQPIFLKIESLSYDIYRLDRIRAVARASEKALLVNEASAGFLNGKVSLYSLHLDPKTLNAGFTLFLEDIDSGRLLTLFPNVRGTANGRHHGKIKLFVKEGGRGIRIRDAFLYSVPGEIGKLKLEDASAVTDNLALAGLGKDDRDNVANALADLDYNVLKLTVERQGDEDLILRFQIEGRATRGSVSAPVTLNLTFRGAFEQLINTSLRLTNQGKAHTP